MKQKTNMKLVGSIILGLTLLGLLLAIGGQLNFLGQERAPNPTKQQTQAPVNNPKYTFYNELKQRKLELDSSRSAELQQPTVATSNSVDEARTFVVQVGAFSQKSDANKVKSKVGKLGYQTRIVKSSTKYLVQAGPFQGKKKAIDIEQRLKNQKFPTLIKRL